MDRAMALRALRAALLMLMAVELLATVPWPRLNDAALEESLHPAWREVAAADEAGKPAAAAVYASTAMLRRCHAAMAWDADADAFVTPPLPLWRSVEALLASRPLDGWAAWQELLMSAKHPWAAYWAAQLLPASWRVMPQALADSLQLLQEGLPLLGPPENDARSGGRRVVSRWVAVCEAPVNASSLRPVDTATCAVSLRANSSVVGGVFTVVPGEPWPPRRRLVGRGPLARMGAAAARWLATSPACASLLRHGAAALRLAVPHSCVAGPLGGLLGQLGSLESEFDAKVLLLHAIVLLALARNWLYLTAVAVKVGGRLALLAPLGPVPAALGAGLTLLGVVLGLWQSLGYAALDWGLELALSHAAITAAAACGGRAGFWLWYVCCYAGLLELRALLKAARLAQLAWREAAALVMHPGQLVQQAGAADAKPPPQRVAAPGPWPPPLCIPDAVDELPLSQVPRGMVCSITRSIMRQPALLLHADTASPSTYEADAIRTWLAAHSTDPKAPGRRLRMRSVKLVYNGDLARAIEDWVSDRAAAAAAAAAAHEQEQKAQQPQEPQASDAHTDGREQQQAQHQRVASAGAAGVVPVAALLAGAGALVRQSSALVTESLDGAAGGLSSLAQTTTRRMTRAAARQQQQQQQQQQAAGALSGSDDDADSAAAEPSTARRRRTPAAAAGAQRRSTRVRSLAEGEPAA